MINRIPQSARSAPAAKPAPAPGRPAPVSRPASAPVTRITPGAAPAGDKASGAPPKDSGPVAYTALPSQPVGTAAQRPTFSDMSPAAMAAMGAMPKAEVAESPLSKYLASNPSSNISSNPFPGAPPSHIMSGPTMGTGGQSTSGSTLNIISNDDEKKTVRINETGAIDITITPIDTDKQENNENAEENKGKENQLDSMNLVNELKREENLKPDDQNNNNTDITDQNNNADMLKYLDMDREELYKLCQSGDMTVIDMVCSGKERSNNFWRERTLRNYPNTPAGFLQDDDWLIINFLRHAYKNINKHNPNVADPFEPNPFTGVIKFDSMAAIRSHIIQNDYKLNLSGGHIRELPDIDQFKEALDLLHHPLEIVLYSKTAVI
jgi:hypothetical protein